MAVIEVKPNFVVELNVGERCDVGGGMKRCTLVISKGGIDLQKSGKTLSKYW